MINLQINGVAHQFDGDPEMPLLWYLRDELQLTGTKYGCGQGYCGACTVHVDGAAARACQASMQSLAGKKVLTIEGLSKAGDHPVQVAWRQCNVPQCGYCQSGQIMRAVALLKKTPQPTDDQIESIMRANLCRCGTYMRIRKAIQTAAAMPGTEVHQ